MMSRSEQLRQYLVDAERAGLLQPSNGHHPSVELPEEISRPGHRPTTQRGNAERLVDSHGHELRWVAAWGWLRYRDGRWQGVHDADVEHLAGEVVRGIYGEAAQEPDSERRKSLAAWAPRSESQGQITAMVQLARGFVLAKPEDFDRQLTLFNVANGTIDLTTGELLLHNPDDMLAKMSPVVFYPEATCPQWMRFLERVLLRNPDIIPYLQQMVGYSMTGLTTEQVLLLLWGLGANGKSTMLEILLELFGEYGKKTPFETFLSSNRDGPRNDLAALAGARLVVAVESDAGRRLNESLLKEITGGDTITARFLHHEHFSYRPQYQVWLGTNNRPSVKEQTHAFWRRLRLVPFQEVIPLEERDAGLSDKLRDELSGILNWALTGCSEYLDYGLTTPKAVLEATTDYQKEEDPLDEYLEVRCITEPEASVSGKDLYKNYQAWEEERGGQKPLDRRWFGRLLTQRGIDQGRTSQERHYLGIRLKDNRDA